MIGSPTTTSGKKGVRKRVTPAGGLLLPSTHRSSSSTSPTFMSMNAYGGKPKYKTPLERIKNTVRSLLVMSLPISIFLLPFLWSSNNNRDTIYPPIIVTLSTTPDRLPFLQPTLESILTQQSLPPSRVYLVLLQEDALHSGFQTQNDLLEAYNEEHISTLPNYLQDLIETTTTLTVLQPKVGLGPLSKIMYALGREASVQHSSSDASTSEQQQQLEESRLVYLDDDVVHDSNLLRQLVDASLDHPESAVALTGAQFRDRFRQIQYANTNTDNIDKMPNLIVRSWNTHGEDIMEVDIVQAVTGVCVPSALLNHTEILHDVLPQIMQGQRQETLPPFSGADDLVVSAVLEKMNVTRLLVPASLQDTEDILHVHFANYSTNVLVESGKGYSNAMEWIETLTFLQSRLGVWEQHAFLDPGELTAQQKQAIACEALHEQDCDSDPDKCLPSATECPEAQSILSELNNGASSEAEQGGETDKDGTR